MSNYLNKIEFKLDNKIKLKFSNILSKYKNKIKMKNKLYTYQEI